MNVRVQSFTVSLDGFGTGEGLTPEAPFGHAGQRLHQWMFATRTWKQRIGEEGGATGVDDDYAASFDDPSIGAEVMGRRKYHAATGPIPDDWRGYWGEEPPFHTPVIVLTHHVREPLVLGETTFHFRDVPLADALAEAAELGGGRDVRLGGGVEVVRQGLAEGLVDEAHLVVSPVVLGRGVRLWDGLDDLEARYDIRQELGDSNVVHVNMTRRS